MKVINLIFLLLTTGAQAAEPWEICFDKADFVFNANSFTRSVRFSKTDCRVQVVRIGGSGQKYEFNLCEPEIQLKKFPSLDSTSPETLYAGSTGCPNPLFGADFHLPPEKKGDAQFGLERSEVLQLIETVKQAVAPNANARNVNAIKAQPQLDSDAQMSCGLYLVSEYLERCVAFEGQALKALSPAQSPPSAKP